MKIKVHEILNSELALFHNEGLQVYQIIANEFKNHSNVILDFSGVERCSTQFLNAVVGKLYLEFNTSMVDSNLNFAYGKINELETKIKEVRANALNHEKYNSLVDHATA